MPESRKAGLESFITASCFDDRLRRDSYRISRTVVCDDRHRAVQGTHAVVFRRGLCRFARLPVVILDLLIMGLVVTITMIGLQALDWC